MSTLRVSNIEAKADVSSPSVNEKVKVTNSNGELLIHIDGATSGITTVGISTSGESFRFDSNQNVTFFGSVTGTGLDVNGNADISGNLNVGGVLTYEDVTNIDSVGVVTARSGLHVTGGNVAIGLNNPSAPLHLSGPAEIRLNNAIDAGNFARIRCFEESGDNGAHLAFSTGAGEVVRLQNDGKVGVNETAPAADLVVKQSGNTFTTQSQTVALFQRSSTAGHGAKIAIVAGTGGSSDINFGDTADEDIGIIQYFHTDNSFRFTTNTSERLRIDSSGNVNFGAEKTVSFPSGTGIQVYNSSAPRIKLVNDTTGNAAGDGLQIYVSGSSAIFDHKENAEMRFYTNATEKLRITSAGQLLHTRSDDTTRYDLEFRQTGGITDGNYSGIHWSQGATGSTNLAAIEIEYATDGRPDIVFKTRQSAGTSMSEAVRIDSNGHLIQGNYTRLFNQNNNNRGLIATAESSPSVYVSDSGNDSTGDGTSSSPFRTITKAWNYIPKVFTHNQTARIMIKGTSYTIDTTYYARGGASGGNWQWGPAVEIRSESGSQMDVYLRGGLRFENVDGLRFNHLNFICDNTNGYLYFNSCVRGKIYNTCDMTVSVTKGWSERVTYDNCQQFVDDMDIDVTSAASSGLGGLVVVRAKSSLSGSRYITKAGSVFGNSAVSVCDDSFVSCNWDVTNFATGYAFGYNHYNAETNGIGMLNGVTITNCTTGIRLRNNSFVRKYNLTYSGNSTNEDIQSGSLAN